MTTLFYILATFFFLLKNRIIWHLNVDSSDTLGKDGNARFTTVPLKALSNQVWIRCQCLEFWKLIIFNCVSTTEKHIGIIRIKHFSRYNSDNIYHTVWMGHCHLYKGVIETPLTVSFYEKLSLREILFFKLYFKHIYVATKKQT